nr:uncharacterized protein LOC117218848 [Megalopta genalis]
MECVRPSSNYSGSAYAVSSTDAGTTPDRAAIGGDNFQCTFFRQPERQRSIAPSLSSDTCTDSENELDVPDTSGQWSHGFPMCFEDQNEPVTIVDSRKSNDAPRVRFCAPVCIDPAPRKRWIQEETGSVPAKLPRIMKRDKCPRKYCPRSEKHCRGTNADPVAARALQCPELAHILPEKFPHPAGDATRNSEGTIGDRIDRNRRLLKSIEEVISTLTETRMNTESKPCIEPSNKPAKTNLVDEILDRGRSKHLADISNETETVPVQRPFFKNPRLERELDESMRKAVTKYRTCWKWREQGFLDEDRRMT